MNSTTARYAARCDSLRLATFSANLSLVNRRLDIVFRVAPSCRSVRKSLLRSSPGLMTTSPTPSPPGSAAAVAEGSRYSSWL